jgi:hypothetical protein
MRIIGAAEGAIMPTIITAHITNTKANSTALHGAAAGAISPMPAGTMRNPLKFIPSMFMSTASQST